MNVRIEAAHGPVDVSFGDEHLSFGLAGRDIRMRWDEIVGAGLARAPAAPTHVAKIEMELLPGKRRSVDVVPFGSRLVEMTRRIGATHRALVIAYGAGPRAFQVFLPMEDPGSSRLVGELRDRLGEKWLEGEWELRELNRRLGLRLGWRGGLLGVAFLVVVGLGGLLAILGWAGVISAVRDGDYSLLRPYLLVPLGLWLGLAWYLLRRLRH